MKKEIKTIKAPSPSGAYSQAILSDSGILYVSSQMPQNPISGKIPESIEDQTDQVIDNIQNILAEAGHCLDDIVKVTVFLLNKDDFKSFNDIYQKRFNKPYPARTVILNDLGNELIEMDIISEKR